MAENNIHAQKQVEEITKMYANLTKEIDKAVAVTKEYQKTNQKLPSEYLKSLQELKKVQEAYTKAVAEANGTIEQYAANQKEIARQEKQNTKLKAQAAQSTTKLAKENAKLNEQRKLTNKQLRDEAKLLVRAQGTYNLIQQRVNKLTKQYNDLAAKKALNNKLTFREEMALAQNQTALLKYQNILKKVDADIGKHTRNVGNYASGFNGLNVSIAQIARELPSAAVSFQTFALGISNNIPMLQDEITKLINTNKQLISQGKPTVNVFKQIGKAIFSAQSILAIGITLFVLYSKEIKDFVNNLFSGKKAIDLLADAYEQINIQMGESIGTFNALIKVIQDTTKSEQDRKGAMQELKDLYPDFNAEILNEKDNTDLVTQAIDDYIKKLGQKAKAQAALKLVQEKYTELLIKEQETQAILDNAAEESLDTEQKRIQFLDDLGKTAEKARKQVENLAKSGKDIGFVPDTEDLRTLSEYNKSREEEAEIQSEINDLLDVYVDNVDFVGKKTKNNNEETEKEIVLLGELGNTVLKIFEGAGKIKDVIDENVIKGLREDLQKQVDDIQPIEIPITVDSTGLLDFEFDILKEQFDELGRLYGIDSSKFTALFDKKANTVDDYVDAAGEAITGLYNLFQTSYEADLLRIQESYQFQTQFAEQGTAAREEIDRQYENERRKIQQKQAEQEKQQAIFSILINTATAVVKALPNIPLSVAVGALGAAQLGFVIAQEIPQFKHGVRNFEGGLAVVGDGGRSEIIGTDKGFYKTPATDTLVNLPKGADVYKSQTEFDKELDKMLSFNGILTEKKYFPTLKISDSLTPSDFNNGINRLEKTIKQGQGSGSLHFDERGFTKFINKHTKTKNNILRLKGRRI